MNENDASVDSIVSSSQSPDKAVIYVDYISKRDNVYEIKAIDTICCDSTPFVLTELIRTQAIQRLDLPDYVTMGSHGRRLIDDDYKLTAFGMIVMEVLCNAKAYPYPKGYRNYDKYGMTMLSFHFVDNISVETFNNKLEEALKILEQSRTIYYFKNCVFKRGSLFMILTYITYHGTWTNGASSIILHDKVVEGNLDNISKDTQDTLYEGHFSDYGRLIIYGREVVTLSQLMQLIREAAENRNDMQDKGPEIFELIKKIEDRL